MKVVSFTEQGAAYRILLFEAIQAATPVRSAMDIYVQSRIFWS